MNEGRQAILCLEPHLDGPRQSGGFFYNDCLAAAAAGEQLSGAHPRSDLPRLTPGQSRFNVQAWDGKRLPSAFVLLDSLWWYVHKRPLDVLAEVLAGRSWGILMHGLPDEASGLLGDMAEASLVVVPSFWAASQLASVLPTSDTGGGTELLVLYPGWDGKPGLLPGLSPSVPSSVPSNPVRIVSSSNWTRGKGLVDAAQALGLLSREPACPPWQWQVAGTPDPVLIAEAHSGLGPFAGRLQAFGHRDPDAVVRLLHGADIFLHPSNQETFCLSVYEATLAGCRVVARAIGGVPEAVQLANLLRHEAGLPPAEVHLASAGMVPPGAHPVPPGAHIKPEGVPFVPSGDTSGADPLIRILEEAFAAVVKTSRAGVGTAGPASAVLQTGLLHEFSWQGRLDKLLRGQSDRPLPAIIQPEHIEES
ncbi:MAG: glycosyltransferase [Spirochaetia bacterium]|jgi:hypothetical protein|nr:glycosyltransferase [Spirochaetia bacterium]